MMTVMREDGISHEVGHKQNGSLSEVCRSNFCSCSLHTYNLLFWSCTKSVRYNTIPYKQIWKIVPYRSSVLDLLPRLESRWVVLFLLDSCHDLLFGHVLWLWRCQPGKLFDWSRLPECLRESATSSRYPTTLPEKSKKKTRLETPTNMSPTNQTKNHQHQCIVMYIL